MWRIHYGDGSTFSSDDGDPFEAPRRDVQAIPYEDQATGFTVISGKDFYVLEDDDRWVSVDHFGLWDYLVRTRRPLVLFGRTITNEEYEQVVAEACQGFPPKSAKSVGER